MSMLSGFCDELRDSANSLERYGFVDFGEKRRDLIRELHDAADTIWELRDDLQEANASIGEAEAENAKLRELVRDMHRYFHLVNVEGLCQWGPTIMRRIRDLGIEVDE